MMQPPEPVHALPQPANAEPPPGCAVKVRWVPTCAVVLHEPGQSIPVGVEVTRPAPAPRTLTVMRAFAVGGAPPLLVPAVPQPRSSTVTTPIIPVACIFAPAGPQVCQGKVWFHAGYCNERIAPECSAKALLDAGGRPPGYAIKVFVKHENHQPTQSFKARNTLAALTALSDEEKKRGVVSATRGNHGAGLAWAGQMLHVQVAICVPRGNNIEKNEAVRGFGAELIEEGDDYDAALAVAERLARERGMTMIHSTNNRHVIAGAATMALEMIEQQPTLDALVLGVGGGSQAVGALTVARAMRPGLLIFGVQAERASAIHDSWHAGKPLAGGTANTFADGLATRATYELTFGPLREGLSGFMKVGESALADALRLLLRTTHNLAEGAGAAGLAGLLALREVLSGKSVGICISGSNIDQETLRRVLSREI